MKVYNLEKSRIYLTAYCRAMRMTETLRALGYMLQKHGVDPEDPRTQKRKDGQLYASHPISMACYALSLEITDDNILAAILLHDVCEDCGTKVEELPFNEAIRRAVRFVTITPFDEETKDEVKRRYFNELLECREALIVKALDRYMNLSTMEGVLSEAAIQKNVRETDKYLLPVLKRGKERYPADANLLHALRTNIYLLNDVLAIVHKVKVASYDPALGVEGSVRAILSERQCKMSQRVN